MLYLIAKHLLSDSYGPLDRLLELGVFLFIAYEVIVGIVRHRRATRRQKELKQIVTSLSQFMDDGLGLQRSVPDTAKEESGVLNLWMRGMVLPVPEQRDRYVVRENPWKEAEKILTCKITCKNSGLHVLTRAKAVLDGL